MAEDIKISGSDAFTAEQGEKMRQSFESIGTAARSMGDAIQGSSNDVQRFIENISRLGDVGKGIEGLTKPIGKAAVPIEKLNKLLLSINKAYATGASGIRAQTVALAQQIRAVSKLREEIDKLNRSQGKLGATGKRGAGGVSLGPDGMPTTKKPGAMANAGKAVIGQVKGAISGTFTQLTGLNFSLMSLVALLLKAYNSARMLSGFGMKAAGQLGGGRKEIQALTRAAGSLYSNFLLTSEQAGQFVQTLADLGMEADDIAGKSFTPKKFVLPKIDYEKEMTAAERSAEAYVKNATERLNKMRSAAMVSTEGGKKEYSRAALDESQRYQEENLEMYRREAVYTAESARSRAAGRVALKHERAEAARRQRELIENMSATTELYAIQTKYNISVAEGGGFVANMVQNYGMLNDEARTFLGTIISAGEEIPGMSPKQVLADMNMLIQSAGTYRTNLVGVQALYKSLQREGATFGGVNVSGMSRTARTEIAATASSWTKSMAVGWKAFLGPKTGAGGEQLSPAARALAFEKLGETGGPGAQFMQFVKAVRGFTAGRPKAEATIMARQLAENVGFPPDAQKNLGDLVTNTDLTQEGLSDQAKKYEEEMNKVAEDRKKWVEDRPKLVKYAQAISVQTQGLEQVIQKQIERFAQEYINPIIEGIQKILLFWGIDVVKEGGGKGKAAYSLNSIMQKTGLDEGTAKLVRQGLEQKVSSKTVSALPSSMRAEGAAVIKRGGSIIEFLQQKRELAAGEAARFGEGSERGRQAQEWIKQLEDYEQEFYTAASAEEKKLFGNDPMGKARLAAIQEGRRNKRLTNYGAYLIMQANTVEQLKDLGYRLDEVSGSKASSVGAPPGSKAGTSTQANSKDTVGK